MVATPPWYVRGIICDLFTMLIHVFSFLFYLNQDTIHVMRRDGPSRPVHGSSDRVCFLRHLSAYELKRLLNESEGVHFAHPVPSAAKVRYYLSLLRFNSLQSSRTDLSVSPIYTRKIKQYLQISPTVHAIASTWEELINDKDKDVSMWSPKEVSI